MDERHPITIFEASIAMYKYIEVGDTPACAKRARDCQLNMHNHIANKNITLDAFISCFIVVIMALPSIYIYNAREIVLLSNQSILNFCYSHVKRYFIPYDFSWQHSTLKQTMYLPTWEYFWQST